MQTPEPLCWCSKPLKTLTAKPFVLLTGGEAATSSLITSPQTWGSLINPSEGMIYRFQLRPLMDWPSSAEKEIPQAEGASPFPPAVDPQLGTVPLVRLLARLSPGLRPGPILHGWPLLIYQTGRTGAFDIIWCRRGTGHSHTCIVGRGRCEYVCVCRCVYVLVCAIY